MLETRPKKSVADYMNLPDEARVELIQGEFFMSPSPNDKHQRAVVRLCARLDEHATRHDLGRVFVAPFDCILSDEDVVQPDVLLVAKDNLGKIRERLHGAPDLAIEVLSRTHAERDRIVKRDLYAKYGVREYWIVDGEARTVEVMTLEAGRYRLQAVFGHSDTLRSSLLETLVLPLSEVFE